VTRRLPDHRGAALRTIIPQDEGAAFDGGLSTSNQVGRDQTELSEARRERKGSSGRRDEGRDAKLYSIAGGLALGGAAAPGAPLARRLSAASEDARAATMPAKSLNMATSGRNDALRRIDPSGESLSRGGAIASTRRRWKTRSIKCGATKTRSTVGEEQKTRREGP
jgi:hypothetical protein